jgi:MFS family permease
MLAWGRFTDRFGNKRALIYSSYLITLVPLAWMLSTNFWYLLAVHIVGNALWAGFNLASFNYILDACSAPKRARCFAYFNIIVGLGTFCGSEVGGKIYELVAYSLESTFMVVLALSCITRLLACLVFLNWFRELRSVEHFSLKEWFFQIAGSRITSYVNFSVFFRNAEDDENPEDGPGQASP